MNTKGKQTTEKKRIITPTEIRKCDNCEKTLTKRMPIEYSAELTEYYCSPDCAMDRYFDHMRSVPLDQEEIKALLDKSL